MYDLNADDVLDAGFYYDYNNGTSIDEIFLSNNPETPNLLTSVSEPYGATVDVSYQREVIKETGQISAHLNSTTNPFVTEAYPIKQDVVSDITSTDNGIVSTYSYEYGEGKTWRNGPFEKKFSGFSEVIQTAPDGTVTTSYFHQGNGDQGDESGDAVEGSKIGKVWKTETKDNGGNTVATTYSTWNNHDLGNDRDFVYLSESVSDVDGKQTATRSTYNTTTGNLTNTQSLGTVNITNTATGAYTNTGQDNRTTAYTYTTGNIQLPSSQTLKDNFNNTVAKSEYFYDSSNTLGTAVKGNLTKERNYITASTYADTLRTYDSYGNVLTETDAEGNTATYVYDSNGHYPISVTNAKNQDDNIYI